MRSHRAWIVRLSIFTISIVVVGSGHSQPGYKKVYTAPTYQCCAPDYSAPPCFGTGQCESSNNPLYYTCNDQRQGTQFKRTQNYTWGDCMSFISSGGGNVKCEVGEVYCAKTEVYLYNGCTGYLCTWYAYWVYPPGQCYDPGGPCWP